MVLRSMLRVDRDDRHFVRRQVQLLKEIRNGAAVGHIDRLLAKVAFAQGGREFYFNFHGPLRFCWVQIVCDKIEAQAKERLFGRYARFRVPSHCFQVIADLRIDVDGDTFQWTAF